MGWALEPIVFWTGLIVTAFETWRRFPFSRHRLFARLPNPGLGLVRASIAFSGLWFLFVLATGAATDIVGYYTWLYVFLAFATLLVASFEAPILGLFYPGDVLERGNLAAALVLSGFVLGTAFAFGGALTGEGPGWWVVVVFFLLAYFELRANLGLVSRLAGGLADDVRLERDWSAGLLLGAVAVSSGLVSGRAAAGDFLGWENGLWDYGRRLWPLLAIAFGSAILGGLTRHVSDRARVIDRAIGSVVLVAAGFVIYFFT